MPELFLERTFDPPIARPDVLAMAETGRSCFGLHRVRWHESLLAAGGHKLVCHFSAQDAESVRLALRAVGTPEGRLWTGTVHVGPDPGDAARAPASVVIERSFETPVAAEEIQAAEEKGWCIRTHRVTFLRTFVSADRRRMICIYQAPDAESVRLAQRYMKMPVDAIWAFTAIRPGD
jgi:hypothetical protein